MGPVDSEARFGAWMAAAQAGDTEAYERLLRALLPPLRAFVDMLLRDPDRTEDVVQQTLLQLHRARHTYRPERPFGPWLRTIARHAAIDSARRAARRRGRELPLADVPEAQEPRYEAADSQGERLSPELDRLVSKLPEAQRLAVELFHLEGLSVADASTRLGVEPGALKARVHRGVRTLRAWLGEEGR